MAEDVVQEWKEQGKGFRDFYSFHWKWVLFEGVETNYERKYIFERARRIGKTRIPLTSSLIISGSGPLITLGDNNGNRKIDCISLLDIDKEEILRMYYHGRGRAEFYQRLNLPFRPCLPSPRDYGELFETKNQFQKANGRNRDVLRDLFSEADCLFEKMLSCYKQKLFPFKKAKDADELFYGHLESIDEIIRDNMFI